MTNFKFNFQSTVSFDTIQSPAEAEATKSVSTPKKAIKVENSDPKPQKVEKRSYEMKHFGNGTPSLRDTFEIRNLIKNKFNFYFSENRCEAEASRCGAKEDIEPRPRPWFSVEV